VELLERVGISAAADRLRQYPHQLSGGLRQRVMIAMALMGGPELLIADEPTTALDVTIQLQILRLLRELQREFGLALLFITHDLGLVSRLANDVLVMYAGQAVERAGCAALFTAPAHPYTRGLLDAQPIPGRVARGAALRAIPGLVETPIGAPLGCRFANRCQLVTEACRTAAVPESQAVEGRWVRCVRATVAEGAA
jgi:peptide/nickel transport system ATP-binding protein